MPSLGIALYPEGCVGESETPTPGTAPVSDVFPVDVGLHRLEIGLRAIQLSPYSTGPAAPRSQRLERPLLSWHALVPFTFQIQVSHQTQEPPSEFLPAALGIQQGASRRSGSADERTSGANGDPGTSLPSARRDVDNTEVVRCEDWPPSWVGTWIGDDGKTVRVVRNDGGIAVTVSPGRGQAAYLSAELLGGGRKRIDDLPARCLVDGEGRRYLEIEAGTPGLGPTYRLYAAVIEDTGLRQAHHDDSVDRLVLVPNTGIGMYDDFDDDLGVPWAYPLAPLRRPHHS
jgi:hypothetical protein